MATLNGLIFDIPEGFFEISEFHKTKKGDKVAHVVDVRVGWLDQRKELSWANLAEGEIDVFKKFAGKVVIRRKEEAI